MAEINKIIDAHGGWPGAFLDKNKEASTQVETNAGSP
jgi:hypothetical protein